MPEVPDSTPVETKIFTLVSLLGKGRQLPESILSYNTFLEHLSKNPPFGTGIKTVGPIAIE